MIFRPRRCFGIFISGQNLTGISWKDMMISMNNMRTILIQTNGTTAVICIMTAMKVITIMRIIPMWHITAGLPENH